MCGVAGAIRVGNRGHRIDLEAAVQRMCGVQSYRGPDDSGVVSLGHCCLGSNRLSIIDLTAAGHMPMSDATRRWWIVYNGEVYNFESIRAELGNRGHRFQSRTDTEVILHAYMEWGLDALLRFVGMFAFAIYDTESGEMTLVRDRYGKKPLYYSREGDTVFFASEMKALMIGHHGLRIDHQALTEWMLYRNVDALLPRTLVEGISAVMPGEVVRIRNGSLTKSLYYSVTSHVSQAMYEEYRAASPEEWWSKSMRRSTTRCGCGSSATSRSEYC